MSLIDILRYSNFFYLAQISINQGFGYTNNKEEVSNTLNNVYSPFIVMSLFQILSYHQHHKHFSVLTLILNKIYVASLTLAVIFL